MNTPEHGPKGVFSTQPSLARRVAVKRIQAGLVIIAEAIAPTLVTAGCIAALFFAISWFGIFRMMPDALRWIALFALVFSFLASLLPVLKLRWPKAADLDRFLEERNHLEHQPVGVQGDAPAFETPFGRILWQEHQTRMAEKISSLDAGLPKPDIAGHDRFALRTVPVLLFVTAAAFSMSNNAGTLTDAFRARLGDTTNPDLRIDAWVTPPAYTGRAPIYLTGNQATVNGAVQVPNLSELTVRITGGNGGENVKFLAVDATEPSVLAMQDDAGSTQPGEADATTNPSPQAAHNHVMKLDESGTLSVNGRQWSFDVVADKGPEIAYDGIPRRSANGALEIGFIAKDDYGLENAYAEIVPADPVPAGAMPLFPLPEYKLDLPRRNAREVKGRTSRDLSEHPLAGRRVLITLVATDAAGQTGRSPPHAMILPGRAFHEPLAAAVAEERQVFSLDVRDLPRSIALNEALALRADETIPNVTQFLLIRSALERMKLTRDADSLKDTAAYLWEIALGIEDGELSVAERKLRDAQQALADALEKNAPDEEIKKRMDELRKAMQEYLAAMAQRMDPKQQGRESQTARNILRQQDLERMMDQIENLARSGNKDAARQMLNDMQRMMNNLQAGRQPRNGQQKDNSQTRQQIDKLGELLRDQQALMEKTFKLDQALRDRLQRGDPESNQFEENPDQPPVTDEQAQRQQQSSPGDQMTEQQLRDALKQLQGQQQSLNQALESLKKGLSDLGVKPGEGFAQAGREMKGAGDALGKGEGDRAVQGQGKALEALRKGATDMMTQMMQAQQGQGQGRGEGQGQEQAGQNGRDPLGRPQRTEGPDFGNQVKVPDEIDIQRAREILDAIRNKLGDNTGPEIERRYLERLIDIK